MRLTEVQELTGLSRTTIWRRVQDGSFPPPIRLGGPGTRAMGWHEQDIYNWTKGLRPAASPPTQHNKPDTHTGPIEATAHEQGSVTAG